MASVTTFEDYNLYRDIRSIFSKKHGGYIQIDGYHAERLWLFGTSHEKRVKIHDAVCNGKWDAERLFDLICYFEEE